MAGITASRRVLPKLSVREKILLLLRDPPTDAGLESTQIGISNSTGLHRAHVSRALHTLHDEGLITREHRRVPGFSRALLVFGLAPAGMQVATELAQSLKNLSVDYETSGAETRIERLGDVLEHEGCGVTLFDAIQRVEEAGVLRSGLPSSRPSQRFFNDLDDAPMPVHFVGRDEELEALQKWLRGPQPFCFIEGPGGIGKSALASRAFRSAATGRHTLWIRLSPNISPALFLARVAQFLRRLGRPLPFGPSLGTSQLIADLARRVGDLPTLLIVDDLHKAGPALQKAFQALIAAAERRSALKVAWLGRSMNPGFWWAGSLRIDLRPLSVADRHALLDILQAPRSQREHLAQRSAGNPLFLELLAVAGSDGTAREGMVEYLCQELFGQSSASDLHVLKHLSVLRRPVPPATFEKCLGRPPADVAHLVEARVVRRAKDGELELHDEIRDVLQAQLSTPARESLHAGWAKAFEPVAGSRSLDAATEYLYHLCQANRRTEAVHWVLSNQTDLLRWARQRFQQVDAPVWTTL